MISEDVFALLKTVQRNLFDKKISVFLVCRQITGKLMIKLVVEPVKLLFHASVCEFIMCLHHLQQVSFVACFGLTQSKATSDILALNSSILFWTVKVIMKPLTSNFHIANKHTNVILKHHNTSPTLINFL